LDKLKTDLIGEIVYNLCDGLENGIVAYEKIFKFCLKKKMEAINLTSILGTGF